MLWALLGAACLAEETPRPPCNAETSGWLWPEETRSNRDAIRRAERCGERLVCSRGLWKYHWRPVTVHWSQLGKGPKPAIPGCPETPPAGPEPGAGLEEDHPQR
jgi:hypothetical protein